ncbi:PREDICTED: uncharacterized protein LOC108620699 [Drosophila arizonae]|uniref:Uncharacterized protein LOC108620699 n=1 Tax=Drosophila arizonae TaxID=7263 RepID=A0ABM1Q0W4_DROAR|nr:PREDICTED: uncharacterized protein LOC108620699 [Drosophila arizonae]
MLFTQLFVLLLLINWCHGESRTRQTRLRSTYDRVFSRRKRAVIFPPGSFLKFTCNFGTGLVSAYPQGVSFALEEAVYFPLPGKTDDLFPQRFRSKKPTAAHPLTSNKKSYVYIPDTDWRSKAQAFRPRPQPSRTHRIDLDSYTNPHNWQHWAKYGSSQAQKWQSSAATLSNNRKWAKWTTPAPKWTAAWTSRWSRPTPRAIAESPHFHGHRDRRQLFEHFSGLSSRFGFDVKSCILRTICDSKRLLLPPGYSMLQDMLRLVFT